MKMPKIKPSILEYIERFDRLPARERLIQHVSRGGDTIASFYEFEPIATPVIEDSKFFTAVARAGCFEERSPFMFKMPNGSEILLRPTGVLSIVRAYMSHKMNDLPHPLKFRFSGESFFARDGRMDAPVSAHEWGLMMIGEEGSIGEAEIIQVIRKTLEEVAGVPRESLSLRVNASGCNECRPAFRSALATFLRSRTARLCRQCKKNAKRMPARILSWLRAMRRRYLIICVKDAKNIFGGFLNFWMKSGCRMRWIRDFSARDHGITR